MLFDLQNDPHQEHDDPQKEEELPVQQTLEELQ